MKNLLTRAELGAYKHHPIDLPDLSAAVIPGGFLSAPEVLLPVPNPAADGPRVATLMRSITDEQRDIHGDEYEGRKVAI